MEREDEIQCLFEMLHYAVRAHRWEVSRRLLQLTQIVTADMDEAPALYWDARRLLRESRALKKGGRTEPDARLLFCAAQVMRRVWKSKKATA